MKNKILCLAVASAFALTLATVTAEDKNFDPSKLPPASTQSGVTYEKDIKPILEKSCVKCHSGEKAKSKLHLDSLEGAIKGGKEGPDIIPGKSGQSPLVYAVAHVGDEDDFMPPPKNKANIGPMTAEQVGLIRAWIDQGAK
jgi:uncharacterized membrane protein